MLVVLHHPRHRNVEVELVDQDILGRVHFNRPTIHENQVGQRGVFLQQPRVAPADHFAGIGVFIGGMVAFSLGQFIFPVIGFFSAWPSTNCTMALTGSVP